MSQLKIPEGASPEQQAQLTKEWFERSQREASSVATVMKTAIALMRNEQGGSTARRLLWGSVGALTLIAGGLVVAHQMGMLSGEDAPAPTPDHPIDPHTPTDAPPISTETHTATATPTPPPVQTETGTPTPTPLPHFSWEQAKGGFEEQLRDAANSLPLFDTNGDGVVDGTELGGAGVLAGGWTNQMADGYQSGGLLSGHITTYEKLGELAGIAPADLAGEQPDIVWHDWRAIDQTNDSLRAQAANTTAYDVSVILTTGADLSQTMVRLSWELAEAGRVLVGSAGTVISPEHIFDGLTRDLALEGKWSPEQASQVSDEISGQCLTIRPTSSGGVRSAQPEGVVKAQWEDVVKLGEETADDNDVEHLSNKGVVAVAVRFVPESEREETMDLLKASGHTAAIARVASASGSGETYHAIVEVFDLSEREHNPSNEQNGSGGQLVPCGPDGEETPEAPTLGAQRTLGGPGTPGTKTGTPSTPGTPGTEAPRAKTETPKPEQTDPETPPGTSTSTNTPAISTTQPPGTPSRTPTVNLTMPTRICPSCPTAETLTSTLIPPSRTPTPTPTLLATFTQTATRMLTDTATATSSAIRTATRTATEALASATASLTRTATETLTAIVTALTPTPTNSSTPRPTDSATARATDTDTPQPPPSVTPSIVPETASQIATEFQSSTFQPPENTATTDPTASGTPTVPNPITNTPARVETPIDSTPTQFPTTAATDTPSAP